MIDNALFENMEILKEKFGITYREAKEVLEEQDNNLIDALIFLEEIYSYKNGCQINSYLYNIKEKLVSLYNEGSNQRIIFSRKGKVIADIPLTAAIVGSFTFILYPILLPFKIGGILLLDIEIKIVDKTGNVYDLNSNVKQKVTTTITTSKDKISGIISNVDLKSTADGIKVKAVEISKKAMENFNDIIENKISNAIKEKSSMYAKFVYDAESDNVSEEFNCEDDCVCDSQEIKDTKLEEVKPEELIEELTEELTEEVADQGEVKQETEEIKDNQ